MRVVGVELKVCEGGWSVVERCLRVVGMELKVCEGGWSGVKGV